VASIFYNFFFCQYRAALLRREPVSRVDHPLDEKIPFSPAWIKIYLDFVAFWVRTLGFLLKNLGRRGEEEAGGFLDSMGRLYAFAGEIYRKNLSTTRRPFYIRGFRFLLIHLFDPHLMCIPSLHVMVVILTYTRFASTVRALDTGAAFSPQVRELRRGALAITEAILYVKQHSVNCVAAAMYAMTCFDRDRFPPEEAERFVSGLFSAGDEAEGPAAGLPGIGGEAGEAVRSHIRGLYRHFLSQGETTPEGAPEGGWTRPLLDFLASAPPAHKK
jgi:hypothetical protein